MISDATRPTRAIFFAGGGDRGVEGAQQLVCALQRAPCESGESRRAFAFECEEANGALGATQSDGDARPQFPSARPTRFFFFYYYQRTASSLQPLHMPHWHCTDRLHHRLVQSQPPCPTINTALACGRIYLRSALLIIILPD